MTAAGEESTPSLGDWLIGRGVSAAGVPYGPPDTARRWGAKGCPVLARGIRESMTEIEMPQEISRISGGPMTAEQMDGSCPGQPEITWEARMAIRKFLQSPEMQHGWDVIPAGVSLGWVHRLPISPRAANGIRRKFGRTETWEEPDGPVTLEEFLKIRNLGIVCANELACVIESAETGGTAGPADGMERPGRRESSLPPHPYEIIEQWARNLDSRHLPVLWWRIASLEEPMTLEGIAQKCGLTREGIRKMEKRILRDLMGLAGTPRGETIELLANATREILGPAAPPENAERLLRPPDGMSDLRGVILALAGGYAPEKDGWLVRADARATDPTRRIVNETPRSRKLNFLRYRSMLGRWGMEGELHDRWLMRHPEIIGTEKQLIRRGEKSQAGRIREVLESLGRPVSIEEITGDNPGKHIRNKVFLAVQRDPELIRVSKASFALTSWGLPEYEGVFRSMKTFIQEQGGRCETNRLYRTMTARFGAKPNTIQAYLHTPAFVQEGGKVRLRTESDAPHEYRRGNAAKPQGAGAFRLGEGKTGIVKKLSPEILKGSGSGIARSAGKTLGMKPSDRLAFTDDLGRTVEINLREHSISGPSIKSVSPLTKAAGAREGDWLTLVLCRPQLSMRAEVTPAGELRRSWETIGRLTGIGENASPESLASALQCEPGKIREVLQRRGEGAILECLPE